MLRLLNSAPFLSAVGIWGIYIALAAALISALAGAAGSIASGRAADIIQRESNERIAQADRRAAEAQERAALANERAAEANAAAEAAKLQAEQLREKISWRVLTGDQQELLADKLKDAEFVYWVQWVEMDPECAFFANQVVAACCAHGNKIHVFSGWERALGVKVIAADDGRRAVLSDALSAVGIRHTIATFEVVLAKQGKKFLPGSNRDEPVILIGSKMEGLEMAMA